MVAIAVDGKDDGPRRRRAPDRHGHRAAVGRAKAVGGGLDRCARRDGADDAVARQRSADGGAAGDGVEQRRGDEQRRRGEAQPARRRTSARSHGRTSSSNQGFRFSQAVFRQDGWGRGSTAGRWSRQASTVSVSLGRARRAEMPFLRVLPDQQRQLDLRHRRQHLGPPGLGAGLRRRQVGALRVIAGKAEGHRHDGDARPVVEARPVEPQPVAQPVARGVVERHARRLDARPGRLAGDQQPRRRRGIQHRARRMRGRRPGEAVGAEPAARDSLGQMLERHRHRREDGAAPGGRQPDRRRHSRRRPAACLRCG